MQRRQRGRGRRREGIVLMKVIDREMILAAVVVGIRGGERRPAHRSARGEFIVYRGGCFVAAVLLVDDDREVVF